MPVLSLVLYAVFFALAFGWRSWRQLRTTGDSGFRGISGRPGSAEWWGGVLYRCAHRLRPLSLKVIGSTGRPGTMPVAVPRRAVSPGR